MAAVVAADKAALNIAAYIGEGVTKFTDGRISGISTTPDGSDGIAKEPHAGVETAVDIWFKL
jgi:hypothetical protein